MRTTIVPAQITTVEDRITGKLGLSQLLLLIMPVFAGSGIFVILPPFFSYATYKVVLIVCVAALSALSAIRIKGKILLFWAIVLLRYNLRPRYYLFNKNDTQTRELVTIGISEEQEEAQVKPEEVTQRQTGSLSPAERIQVENLISNPAANLRIVPNKKGGLSVYLTEVQQ